MSSILGSFTWCADGDDFLLAHLESAYSLIWGARRIWGQDLGTFMTSRPN